MNDQKRACSGCIRGDRHSPKAVEKSLNTTVETIIDAVTSGDSVTIPGFGTFFTKHRAPRVCRNPKTGEPVKVDACEVPVFKPGKRLKEACK